MSFTYNLLKGSNTRLRGLLAEEIAASYARNYYNLVVYRPKKILRDLVTFELENTPIFQFIETNKQTMDFFGVWPRNVSIEVDWNLFMLQIFRGPVLDSFLSENAVIRPKGYIIEVKSGSSRENISKTSDRQKNMIREGKKLNLNILLPQVAFERDWQIRCRFFDENNKVIHPEEFQIQE